MKKAGLWILILGLLLLVAVAFIVVYDVIIPSVASNQEAIYNAGAQDAIVYIAQSSLNCQTVPLIIGNQTISLVDVSCVTQTQ